MSEYQDGWAYGSVQVDEVWFPWDIVKFRDVTLHETVDFTSHAGSSLDDCEAFCMVTSQLCR